MFFTCECVCVYKDVGFYSWQCRAGGRLGIGILIYLSGVVGDVMETVEVFVLLVYIVVQHLAAAMGGGWVGSVLSSLDGVVPDGWRIARYLSGCLDGQDLVTEMSNV